MTNPSLPALSARRPGSPTVWRESDLFLELREAESDGAWASGWAFESCRGGCLAAKFFTGLPLDGPDPECVRGYDERCPRLSPVVAQQSSLDHSASQPVKNGPVMFDPGPDSHQIAVATKYRLGHSDVHDLTAADTVMPPGFAVALGVPR